jgi:ribosomal protein L11 methyltransferase
MNKTSNWIEIIVKAEPLLLEELSASFFEIGCQGINENEKSFTLYFENKQWNDHKKAEVTGILAQKNIPAADISFNTIEEENWIEKWKENFKIFRVGKNIIVQPDWENYQAQADEQVVTIIPKMAFGTGHHETTQLILKQLEKTLHAGMSVLDAGCGTAILSIYAALKGAERIVAFDIDPVAIENARENVLLNKAGDKIELKCSTLQEIDSAPFDLIVANINRDILLELATAYVNYSRPGTLLILSGLLDIDGDVILKKYKEAGWQEVDRDHQGEWLCLNLIKI